MERMPAESVQKLKRRTKPELLVPAGSLEVLRTAVVFGADAVYIGGEEYGLRAKAKNFSLQEMAEGIAFAHARGAKVYVTANIFAHNADLPGVRAYFSDLKKLAPDALILSDPGIFRIASEICPELEIHISTQANNTNSGTFRFWHELGAKRVVAARELTLAELTEIRADIPEEMEMEVFIHGAMCISYSGRCLLSNYFTGRDANRGACTHPCRWNYAVVEETRPGEYLPVEENERGTYLFNSRDLCMVEHIPELVESGIDSFKIEGRMKTALYVAAVTRTYRLAIDAYFADPVSYGEHLPWYLEQIGGCTHRRFSTGFFFGRPDETSQIYDESTYVKEYTYLGCVAARAFWTRTGSGWKQRERIGQEVEETKMVSEETKPVSEKIEKVSVETERIPEGTRPVSEGTEMGSEETEPVSAPEKIQPVPSLEGFADKMEEPVSAPAMCRIFAGLEQKNKFSVGERVEIMKPDGRNVQAVVCRILDEEGNEMESAPHARQKIWIELRQTEDVCGTIESEAAFAPQVYDLIRRKEGQEDTG